MGQNFSQGRRIWKVENDSLFRSKAAFEEAKRYLKNTVLSNGWRQYICEIDQAWSWDGCIMASPFSFIVDRIRGRHKVEAHLLKRNNVKKINNKTILIKLHLNRTSLVNKGFITRPKHTHLATSPWHDRSILPARVAVQNRIRVILPTHAASHIINLCITWFLSSTNLLTVYSIRKRFYSDNPTVFNWQSFRHRFHI